MCLCLYVVFTALYFGYIGLENSVLISTERVMDSAMQDSGSHLQGVAAILCNVIKSPAQRRRQLSDHFLRPGFWVEAVLHNTCENAFLRQPRCHGCIVPLGTCIAQSCTL